MSTQQQDGGTFAPTERVHRLAAGLKRGSALLVLSCVVGLGFIFGLVCHFLLVLARGPLSSGSTPWEIAVAAGIGMLLGLGISLPFYVLFRLQAALAEVDIRLEEHAREANAKAAETARSIQELTDAGMSGEWGISGYNKATDVLGPSEDSSEGDV